jgi:glycosyltransferase involved in cell wall biosynthesis
MPGIDNNLKFTVFLNYFRRHEGGGLRQYPNTEINSLKIPRRVIDLLWKIDQLPFDIFLKRPDILHSLYIPVPPVKKVKNILTIHDCRYFAVPQLYRHKDVKKYKRLMEMSIKRVDHIAAVSEFTKQEVLKYFSFPEERIKVINNGFSQRKPDEKFRYRVKRWYVKNGLDQPYLLYTGVLDPRKNLDRLVESIALCKEKSRDFPLLVIAGIPKEKWVKNAIADKANRLGINNSIYVCGEVENDILPWLIKNAHASCYLSLYEGFGFPPLEAMSLGVPVIAGNSSSIPEVTGRAACLVNPNSIDEISKGLNEIVYNQNYRLKLIDEGYKQTKKFTWKKASEKYVDLYKVVSGL